MRAGTPDVAEGVVNWRIEARNVSAEGDETRRDYGEVIEGCSSRAVTKGME